MSSYREQQIARLRGTNEATRELVRRAIDTERAVDVFGVIEDQRVWLLFEPLDRLFGFFQRESDAAGIALHSGHPLSVQRFTAAHEYGHYVLGHEASQDSPEELFGSTVPLQELEAQSFAAEFLMPLRLVNRALDRLELAREPKTLEPIEAYQLSLELGSSYRATVTQLSQLNKLTRGRAHELLGWKPIDIKTELGGGEKPGNSRADVWDLHEQHGERKLDLRIEDELHVRLPEIPSSGYRWEVQTGPDLLEPVRDQLEGDLRSRERLGSSLRRHLWWRATEPGRSAISLRLVRAWEPEAPPLEALQVEVRVAMPRTGLESTTGISLPQRRALIAPAT